MLRHGRDFRQIVVDYAAELAAQGCFYAEPLFSPSEPMMRGTPWEEIFDGYCDGADEARERHGVELRFTPDITRNFPPEIGERLAEWAVRFRDRGVAGISLGGSEHRFPPAPFARAFAIAREGGLKAAPHAGETAGPASIRSALDDLHADRLRHGVRAVEDPALLAELAARGVVCDVTPVSNLRTGVVTRAGRAPAAGHARRRRQVLHRERRPGAHGDVALRGRRRRRPPGAHAARHVRARRGGRVLRRADARPPRGRGRGLRLGAAADTSDRPCVTLRPSQLGRERAP